MRHIPYIPQTIGELMDQLGSMMLGSPSFKDRTGYFPQMNIDTEFFSLNEGLNVIRKKLGDERYTTLRAMSDQMRALFESDPENTNGGTKAGCKLIREMKDVLKSAAKRRTPQ
jgi:hypothetical protein